MSRIFLSHSSADDFDALALRDWLALEGWNDVFLDVDPDRGIAAGQRWERRLHEAASRCEAVLFLVSSNWLASSWCLKEYTIARRLNKKLFAVLIGSDRTAKDLPPELIDTWQIVDLAGGQDMELFRVGREGSHEEKHVGFSRSGLHRLKRGLQKAGLDARFFSWPPENEPDRAPYRGLKPLEATDAGILFGRDAPIVEATDRLRGLEIGAPPRLMVILGASGAGKSSFLRAGLLPRLTRDDRHFVPLPPIRPERAALTGENGLLRALETVCPTQTRAQLRSAIQAGAAGLRPILKELVQRTFRQTLAEEGATRPPAIVIAIDQSEELFRADGSEEGQRLLEMVRDLVVSDDGVAVIVIFAIRSDSYDALEHVKALEGLRQDAVPLLPMPRGAYKEVIEGPAHRASKMGDRLTIDPQLTERLLADIEAGGGSDALPLLAFTLEQLYLEYHKARVLRLTDYEAIGGLSGAIDRAVERAFVRADADLRIPRDREAREAILRRGLIPWLAGIDPDTKMARRNIAWLSEIPGEAKPLVALLVEERLLSTDAVKIKDPTTGAENRVVTIEPAHEALLRQWGLLQDWLAEDFALLATLEGLHRASRDWEANGRVHAWLAHQGQRLTEAQSLDQRGDIAAKIGLGDRAYLSACREKEEAARSEVDARRQEREEEQARALRDACALADANKRRTRAIAVGLIGALVFAAASLAFGWDAHNQRLVAEGQTVKATSEEQRARRSALEAAKQRDAARQSALREREALKTVSEERNRALLSQSRFLVKTAASLEADPVSGALLAVEALPQEGAGEPRPYTPEAEAALAQINRQISERFVLAGHTGAVTDANFSPDGRLVVTSSKDGAIRIWDAGKGERLLIFQSAYGSVSSATFSPDGKAVLIGTEKGQAFLLDRETGRSLVTFEGHAEAIKRAVFSPDGRHIATTSDDGTARVWDATTGQSVAVLRHKNEVRDVAFSPGGDKVATMSLGLVNVWNLQTSSIILSQKTEGFPLRLSYRPDGKQIAIVTEEDFVLIWDLSTAKLSKHSVEQKSIGSVAFSHDGQFLAFGAKSGTVQVFRVEPFQTFHTLGGHVGSVEAVNFSLDDKRLVTASADGTARIWDVDLPHSSVLLQGHKGQVFHATFSPDGRHVATTSDDNTVRVWDSKSGQTIATLKGSDGPRKVAFVEGGQRVIADSKEAARIWSVSTGELIHIYPSTFDPALSANGTFLATQAKSGVVQVWNTTSGQPINGSKLKLDPIGSAEISPDGLRLVVQLRDGTMHTVHVDSNKDILISKQPMWIGEIASDDRHAVQLAAGAVNGMSGAAVSLRDIDTGLQTASLTGHDMAVFSAHFSADAKQVVTASWDKTASIWDVTGRFLQRLVGHDSPLRDGRFSPDGRRVMTIAGKTARFWDVRSGEMLDELNLDADGDVTFSQDGRQAVTVQQDNKTARVWRIFPSTADLIDDVKKKVPRCLTGRQRKQNFLTIDPPDWCIDANKWPYDAQAWKTWLKQKRKGIVAPSPYALAEKMAESLDQSSDLFRNKDWLGSIKKLEMSLTTARQLISLDESSIASQHKVASILNSLCFSRLIIGQLNLALSDCNESLKWRTGDPDALDTRGALYLREGHFKQAIADYDEALRVSPKSASSLYGRGLARIKNGEEKAGQADVEAAKTIQHGVAEDLAVYGIH